MSSWQPSPEGIAELVNVLRDSTSEDSSVQAQVTKVRPVMRVTSLARSSRAPKAMREGRREDGEQA